MRWAIFLMMVTLALPVACSRDSVKASTSESEGDDEPKAKKKKQAAVEDEDDEPKAKKKKKKKKSGYVEGPLGFPLPKDAGTKSNAPGGAGKIVMYEVPRARDEVADELETFLDEAGWTIDSKEKSPMGTRRLSASKDGSTVKASVAGQGEQSGIILTLP